MTVGATVSIDLFIVFILCFFSVASCLYVQWLYNYSNYPQVCISVVIAQVMSVQRLQRGSTIISQYTLGNSISHFLQGLTFECIRVQSLILHVLRKFGGVGRLDWVSNVKVRESWGKKVTVDMKRKEAN